MSKTTLPDRECFVCREPDNRNARHVISIERRVDPGAPGVAHIAVFRCFKCQTRTEVACPPEPAGSDRA